MFLKISKQKIKITISKSQIKFQISKQNIELQHNDESFSKELRVNFQMEKKYFKNWKKYLKILLKLHHINKL